MEGIVHSIESLAARDGAGLRCAVFLAGCPLRCVFCHNPDTWHKIGTKVSPEDLVKKISRFKPYFGKNGGATFSGGEPLLQADFLSQTVPLLKAEGIPYVIDTSGSVVLSEEVCFVLKNAQAVLLDLKFWDDDSYLKFTGSDMKKTKKVLLFLKEQKIPTVIRTVVIPEINDSEEILSRYFDHLESFSSLLEYELLGFHTMGFFKYENLGIKNPLEGKKAMDPDRLLELQSFVNEKIKTNG